MVIHHRKKVGRYRGHTTHGGGHRKKRRGAGSRGGRGMAGTGKRAGHKKAGIKYKYLGKEGFLPRRPSKELKTINVGDLTMDLIARWLKENKVTKEKDHVVVDLKKLGYGKLLGTGKTALKLKMMVERCSAKAEEKIKAAGGEVIRGAAE